MAMSVSLETSVSCSSRRPQKPTGKGVGHDRGTCQQHKDAWFPRTWEKVSKRNFKMLALVI